VYSLRQMEEQDLASSQAALHNWAACAVSLLASPRRAPVPPRFARSPICVSVRYTCAARAGSSREEECFVCESGWD